MREFGITFFEGLRKGLRPFIVSIPQKEMLIECFNWMPHENGLLAHEEISELIFLNNDEFPIPPDAPEIEA